MEQSHVHHAQEDSIQTLTMLLLAMLVILVILPAATLALYPLSFFLFPSLCLVFLSSSFLFTFLLLSFLKTIHLSLIFNRAVVLPVQLELQARTELASTFKFEIHKNISFIIINIFLILGLVQLEPIHHILLKSNVLLALQANTPIALVLPLVYLLLLLHY